MQSNNVVNVLFDHELTLNFIYYISADSTLKIWENFPKPYFCIEKKNKYILKGAVGNNTAKLYITERNCKDLIYEIIILAESYKDVYVSSEIMNA